MRFIPLPLRLRSPAGRTTSVAGARLLSRLVAFASMLVVSLVVPGCSVIPEPFQKRDLQERARLNLSTVASDQAPVDKPIGLYEAMARALKYNLDYRVAMMEEAVRSHELERARMDMLPQLVANSGYAHRNNDSGGTSISILSRRESLEPSTSVERSYWASDLTLSWDILDFGLSYVRARQAADQVLISLENRRKVANRMIEDVRTVYWRAISAQRLLGQLGVLERQVEQSLRESFDLEQRRTTNPMAALSYQRELIDVQRQVQALQRELVISKAQLAALMNVPPDTPIELEIPGRNAASTDIC